MIVGIDRWVVSPPDIHEPRLQRQLGVQGFISPPATDNGNDVPVTRFPLWHTCSTCQVLDEHRRFADFNSNKCAACGDTLIPSRFVIACPRGHIDDFPFFMWVHRGITPTGKDSHRLSLHSTGASASLSDIVVRCSCGLSSTMYGAFDKDAMRRIRTSCSGRRPWLGDTESCNETPRTLQRGASNAYFGIVRSALSIPPWSEGAYKLLNKHWVILKAIPDNALAPTIAGMRLSEGTSYSAETLIQAVRDRRKSESGGQEPLTEKSLRHQEYEALLHGQQETSRDQDFVCTAADVSEEVEWFDRVMSVKRLREVRALEAFTRLLPPSPADPPDRRAPLARTKLEWLPAIEVLGEGVFLKFSDPRLREWEVRPEVVARAAKINSRYEARFRRLGLAPDRDITPRLILTHTVAHALINQWALNCGYPAASLRERLYHSEERAGILIYTATTDAAGSLGGVVSQVEGGNLGRSLRDAIESVSWCSGDPLCIEADAAGVDALNLGACHACVLLPETSCEESNTLLDRALLIGTLERPDIGFFSQLLERDRPRR